MGRTKLILIAAITAYAVSGLRGEDERVGIPYNTVNMTMRVLKSQEIDGVDCVPFYMRSKKKGEPLDVDRAKFRLRTWDGEIVLLKVTPLLDIPAADRSDIEKKMIEAGFTHIQWIPKNKKSFMDGSLLHDLPKGSVEMAQGLHISGKFLQGEGKR